jgi:glutamate carboxypeptidase
MTALLERLARSESPSDDREAQEWLLALLAAECEARGLAPRIYRRFGNPLLLALPRQRRRCRPLQLLVGHCDTVWPVGTLDGMPVERRDGHLYGPGVFDMKGGLVQMLFAVQAAWEVAQDDLAVTPVLLVSSDEEVGSRSSKRSIVRLARYADRVFVAEPALGRRGRLKTARKGIGRFVVTIEGRAAHAGLAPRTGASAILELSHVVQRLHAMNDPDGGTTVNVGKIDGGLAPNVVAPRARCEVDVRVLSVEAGRRVEAAIHGLRPTGEGVRLHVEGGVRLPPMERTPGNRRLWRMAKEEAAALGLDLLQATAGGASDGNLTSPLAPTLDGLGAVGDGAHAAHENVVLDRMPERAALLALLLLAPPLGRSAPAPDPGEQFDD